MAKFRLTEAGERADSLMQDLRTKLKPFGFKVNTDYDKVYVYRNKLLLCSLRAYEDDDVRVYWANQMKVKEYPRLKAIESVTDALMAGLL